MPEKINAQMVDAILEQLYAKRNEIDISINTMLLLKASDSIVVPEQLGSSGAAKSVSNGGGIASNAFFGMSLVDAAKKCIELKQARLNLQQIVAGLEQGGMPGQKPNTVYAALRRRESTVGDITRVDDLWGLKEWSAGISVGKASKAAQSKKGKKKGAKKAAKKAAKTTATAATPKLVVVERAPEKSETETAKQKSSTTIRDAAFEVLSKEGAPLHAEVLAERINKDYSKTTNQRALAASLKDDGEQRFDNIGHNTWALNKWPEEKKKLKAASATAQAAS
jgi:hypothetical protein